MRSLLFTEPVDFLIGNSYGKYLERDTGTPLIRLTFPIFDRHHHHRFPLWGYQGGLRVLTTLLDKIFDKLDRETNVPRRPTIPSISRAEVARRPDLIRPCCRKVLLDRTKLEMIATNAKVQASARC